MSSTFNESPHLQELVMTSYDFKNWAGVSVPCSELPPAAAWPEPAWRHHQVRIDGQAGDQQTAQTEGEEERVDESVDGNLWKMSHDMKRKVEGSRLKKRGEFQVKGPPLAWSLPQRKTHVVILFSHIG